MREGGKERGGGSLLLSRAISFQVKCQLCLLCLFTPVKRPAVMQPAHLHGPSQTSFPHHIQQRSVKQVSHKQRGKSFILYRCGKAAVLDTKVPTVLSEEIQNGIQSWGFCAIFFLWIIHRHGVFVFPKAAPQYYRVLMPHFFFFNFWTVHMQKKRNEWHLLSHLTTIKTSWEG